MLFHHESTPHPGQSDEQGRGRTIRTSEGVVQRISVKAGRKHLTVELEFAVNRRLRAEMAAYRRTRESAAGRAEHPAGRRTMHWIVSAMTIDGVRLPCLRVALGLNGEENTVRWVFACTPQAATPLVEITMTDEHTTFYTELHG